MRTIGLIGGMSWVSTAEYYRLANQEVASRLGGLHSAKILLESVDFAEIEELKLADRWDEIGVRLAAAGRRLEAAGAELVVLCTNRGSGECPVRAHRRHDCGRDQDCRHRSRGTARHGVHDERGVLP
jgi:hypothetical protein